jgi:hypothetical protein
MMQAGACTMFFGLLLALITQEARPSDPDIRVNGIAGKRM